MAAGGAAAGATATWVTWALVAASIASVAASTYGAVQASENAADLASAAAKQREQEALNQEDEAKFAEQQHRRKIRLLLGKQAAILGASGLDPMFGSPLLQEIDLVKQGELEALNIRRQGKLASSTSSFESRIANYQSRVSRGAIPYQIGTGIFSAGASGLGAYSSASGLGKRTVADAWGV